ncbi:unnamed protein product [marine sediment metagenome]|uniref:DUF2442 domain-containing protein n=1 Tax=marine sediment metagenome TaxID=412755 RepID=X0WND7_9ZZZZ
MDWDIINLEYIEDYKLRLTFKTGKKGIVDLGEYSKKGGVFSRFSDIEYFKKVYVDHGVLCWTDNVDIAPETIYSMATGEPLPEWMEMERKH